jgi:phage gpG-like protein
MSDPAAVRFTLALPGLQALSVGLSRLRTDISDWTKFWVERFAPGFYRQVLQDFVLEGGNSGASWAALSPAYAVWKQAHYPGAGILVRSGALKASLTDSAAADAIFNPGPTTLEIGTSVPYAMYHQVGTSRLPQRPPLRMSAAFITVVGQQMQLFVQETWAARHAEIVAAVNAGVTEPPVAA